MNAPLVVLANAALCLSLFCSTAMAQTNRRGDFSFDPTILSAGSIGVSVRDLTAAEATKAKLTDSGGVIVTVADGSEAARAGFQNGDIVIEFDGERVRSARQFTRLVQESAVGRAVKAVVQRDSSRRTIEVTPRSRNVFAFTQPFDIPALDAQIRPLQRGLTRDLGIPGAIPPDTLASPRRLGATLTTLDDQLGSYFGATSGALVLSVLPRSAAETAGLKGGDVIVAVNGRGVRRPSDVAEALRDGSSGERLELKVIRERKDLTLTVRLGD